MKYINERERDKADKAHKLFKESRTVTLADMQADRDNIETIREYTSQRINAVTNSVYRIAFMPEWYISEYAKDLQSLSDSDYDCLSEEIESIEHSIKTLSTLRDRLKSNLCKSRNEKRKVSQWQE